MLQLETHALGHNAAVLEEELTWLSAVARANGLTGFRRLRPGMQLLFPQLRTSAR